MIILFVIIYSSIITPLKLAFEVDDKYFYEIDDYIVDSIFFIDIILAFSTGYYDENDNVVTNHSKIIRNYLLSWFIVDLISIFPISYIINSRIGYVKNFVRLTKITRLYKLVKFSR